VEPVDNAVVSPDPDTDATAEEPLQVPPDGLPVSKEVEPTPHNRKLPVIVTSSTVTVTVVEQPDGAVYVISTVPAAIAVTSPDPDTDATPEDPLQVPPAGLPVNKEVEAMPQSNVVPVIAGASTVTICVTIQPAAEV
jgi:hypothetical protein